MGLGRAPAVVGVVVAPAGADDDLLAVLEQFEGDDLDGHPFRLVLLAHGDGEASRRMAARLDGLVSVVGAPGTPFDTGLLAAELATLGVDAVAAVPLGSELSPGWWARLARELRDRPVAHDTGAAGPCGIDLRALGDGARDALRAAFTGAPATPGLATTGDTATTPPTGAPVDAVAVYATCNPGTVPLVAGLLDAVARVGLPAELVDVASADAAGAMARVVGLRSHGARLANVFVGPPEVAAAMGRAMGDAMLRGGPNVVLWDPTSLRPVPRELPEWLDEVWCTSDAAAATGAAGGSAGAGAAAAAVRYPVPVAVGDLPLPQDDFGGRPYVVASAGPVGGGAYGDVATVVKAWRRAVATPGDALLVVDAGALGSTGRADLAGFAGGRADIVVADGIAPEAFAAACAHATAVVALRRRGGFPFVAAEAMAAGVAVVANAVGGGAGLVEPSRAFVVGHTEVPGAVLGEAHGGELAACCHVTDAALALRAALADAGGRDRRASAGLAFVRRHHTPAATAAFVATRFGAR